MENELNDRVDYYYNPAFVSGATLFMYENHQLQGVLVRCFQNPNWKTR
jgi:hypothetical protein